MSIDVDYIIKSCPHCGGECSCKYLITRGFFCVSCNDCGAIGPMRLTKGEAVRSWNRRIRGNPMERVG